MLASERHLLVEVARQLASVAVYLDVGCLLVHKVGAAHDAHEVDGVADDGLVGDVFHQRMRRDVVHEDLYGYGLTFHNIAS